MFKVETKIEDRRVADLLCCAIEGGIGYWACIIEQSIGKGDVKPWGEEYTPEYIQAPFCEAGFILFEDEEDGKKYQLTRGTMTKGLKIMAKKYPWHFGNFMSDNADSITGDAFVQCCLLGDIVYG